mgnify:FL=1|jgi:hypothetical protein|tara:strand:- start:189 stop:356 length:168 start_codon:yes stop_codon:yes gene_type:complete
MKTKKPKPRKRKLSPFKELVLAMEKKTQLPESSGRGVVSGNDVSRMKDFLSEQGK